MAEILITHAGKRSSPCAEVTRERERERERERVMVVSMHILYVVVTYATMEDIPTVFS
jgi:hypothetical protein